MLIRLKLLKNWGGYKKDSIMDFGEIKGRPLIAKDTAIEVSENEKINKIIDSGGGLVRVKLIKTWGGFCVGSVLDLGESKGRTLIELNMAIEVGKTMNKVKIMPKKKNPPKVEVAMIEPIAETAEVTPKKKPKKRKKQREKQGDK
jgi:hypothetical protein